MPIFWQPCEKGACLLDLCGSINIGLIMVFQSCVCVCVCIHKYLYVDPNTIAQKVSMHHVGMLLDRYTKLLLDIVLHGYLGALPHDITLLGAQDLDDVGPMDMVIIRWLY
jgi:hypothetical protein